MKIKVIWGFVDQAVHHRTGEVLEVNQQVGHDLIGRGLAVEFVDNGRESPKSTKPVAPKEMK